MTSPELETVESMNCPKCGAHDYGLFAGAALGCPHCLAAELKAWQERAEKAERERDLIKAGAYRRAAQAAYDMQSDQPLPGDWNDACTTLYNHILALSDTKERT